MTGYLHERYAQSLAEFGTARLLPESRSWILERTIPGSIYRDAMGCYPLFASENWSGLRSDLEELDEVVAVSVVTDPFGDYDLALLTECFSHRVKPFKEHFIVDLSRDLNDFVHPHHLRNAKKGETALEVELIKQPLDYLERWVALYGALVKRHDINGIAAFSPESFALQLTVPGLVAFKAVLDGNVEGMLLWYVQGDVGYYHLGAYSARGYDLRASFALFRQAIEHFQRAGLRWLNLGGAAGAGENRASGLSRFKEGWSTGVRETYFCGRIIDPVAYKELIKTSNINKDEYFPAYRAGEFA